jgi:hypothetical protein
MYTLTNVPDLKCGYFCNEEKTTIHSIDIKNSSMYGSIGTTQCCGSASVYGLPYYKNDILNFLKETRCSIVVFNSIFRNPWGGDVDISGVTARVNEVKPKVFQVSYKVLSYKQVLLVVDILDPVAYYEWLQT